jgi:hypothetical protein
LTTYSQGLNEYSDIGVEDFNDNVNGFLALVPTAKVSAQDFVNVVAPSSLNYTALGWVTAVRNQVKLAAQFVKLLLEFSFSSGALRIVLDILGHRRS